MDGMLTQVVGQVDVAEGPRPFVTSDALALRAVSDAHARAMAREAGRIAAEAGQYLAGRLPFDPVAAVLTAEQHHRVVERRRVFNADRLAGLRDAGRISQAQYRAVTEISDILHWFDAGKQVLARSQFSERLAATTGGLTMQQRLEEAERLRYGPWRAEASQRYVKRDRSRTLEDLVRVFIVRRLGLRQLADCFGLHQERTEGLLIGGLRRYAMIAGWETETA